MGSIISLIGWNYIDDSTLTELRRFPRTIMVISHTTYFDFALYIAYYFTQPTLSHRGIVLINPTFMERWGWLAKGFGAIKSTRREDRNGGVIDEIYSELKDLDEFIFIISPKGCLPPKDWRTGYYHLAKRLDCHILPTGFDYQKKKLVVKRGFKINDMSFEEVTKKTQYELRDIVTYRPDFVEYPVTFSTLMPVQNLISTERAIVLIVITTILITIFIIIMYYLWKRWRNPPNSN